MIKHNENLCVYNTNNKNCNGIYVYKKDEEIKKLPHQYVVIIIIG